VTRFRTRSSGKVKDEVATDVLARSNSFARLRSSDPQPQPAQLDQLPDLFDQLRLAIRRSFRFVRLADRLVKPAGGRVGAREIVVRSALSDPVSTARW
jgi:hypothetical protein